MATIIANSYTIPQQTLWCTAFNISTSTLHWYICISYTLLYTSIYSDDFTSYRTLHQLGYIHLAVNHSKPFVDPNTGVHINNIEGLWSVVKWKFKRMNGTPYQNLPGYLDEFMWRSMMITLWQLWKTWLLGFKDLRPKTTALFRANTHEKRHWLLCSHFIITYQPRTDHLPTTHWPLTDHLPTTYRPLFYGAACSQLPNSTPPPHTHTHFVSKGKWTSHSMSIFFVFNLALKCSDFILVLIGSLRGY